MPEQFDVFFSYHWRDREPVERVGHALREQGLSVEVLSKGAGATPRGIHDLAGNVWEWTSTWSNEIVAASADPRGPSLGEWRVLRGGSFDLDPEYLRAAYRYYNPPDHSYDAFGFRVVWSSSGGPN